MTKGRKLLRDLLNKLSQSEVSETSGISAPTLNKLIWQEGRVPSVPIAVKLEQAYGIPVSAWTQQAEEETGEKT